MKKTAKPPFNELAKPNMNEEAKAVMEEAMQKSCDEQDEMMKAHEVAQLIKEQYGDVLKRLSKT